MLIASGLAPDLDYASYFGGASAFMRFHRTLLHSIAGTTILACLIGAAFCLLDRKMPRKKRDGTIDATQLGFGIAFLVCAIGATGHIILDLASGVGVQLLWPFRAHWSAWNIAPNFDPWILLLLVGGLLLPLLLKLVNEEVTSGKKAPGGRVLATIILAIIAAYLGLRARMHGEAVDLLLSREYHGRVALSGDAYPETYTARSWRGVVVTDNTVEDVEVPLGGDRFDPNDSVTHYKPEDSPALEAGEKSDTAVEFLKYAQLPIASVRRIEADYRVEVRDARFPEGDTDPANIFARIDLDSQFRIRSQGLFFASSPNP
jgi:membrane-bound metal-dependent hydrolase YbcI (DUF457 family)